MKEDLQAVKDEAAASKEVIAVLRKQVEELQKEKETLWVDALHSVEISEFVYHSNFTWNQYLGLQKFQKLPSNFDIFEALELDFDEFCRILGLEISKKKKEKKKKNQRLWKCKNGSFWPPRTFKYDFT